MSERQVEFLLVEDNPVDVELALHAFGAQNLAERVLLLRDGVELLDYLFRTGEYEGQITAYPKAILLDLKLPRIGGLEVVRRIKADARTRAIPVIVLTTSREQRDIVESYKLGVNSYIVKPVDFDQFREAVRALGLYWLVMNETPELELHPD